MDGFLTLIIIVIVFNLISAVLRAIKGGGATVDKQMPAGAVTSERQSSRHFSNAEISDPDSSFIGEYITDHDAEDVYDITYRSHEPEATMKFSLTQETSGTTRSEPAETLLITADQVSHFTPILGIKKVLTEKDSFLAAFVLREILDTPPTLRRWGRLEPPGREQYSD